MRPRLVASIPTALTERLRLRVATDADVARCDRIARQQPRGTLPYLPRVQLASSAAKGELYIADVAGIVVGFVRWHARQDGWQTIYDLAVAPGWQGQGIGRLLVDAVCAPTRLKCPVTSAANSFYAGIGFRLTSSDGRLNTWERRILALLCMGGNAATPALARRSHMAYGVRSDYTAFAVPFMVDVPFKPERYSWRAHAKAVHRLRPVMALALDYDSPTQKAEILRQVQEFRNWGILRPTVCCKFNGAVADMPDDVVIALSVPSQYAGFVAETLSDYRGRRVHLLGGVPQQWLKLIPQLHGVGATVISVDGSAHESAAKKGTHWQEGVWVNHGKKADYAQTIIFSGREIVRQVNACAAMEQLPLFAA